MLLFYGLTFLLGLVFGSFVNVLVWRLPLKISLGGRSICPNCRQKIAWYDNIPVFSFLFLHGHCRRCRETISWRYPAIELGVAAIFTLLVFVSEKCFFFPALDASPVCAWLGSLGISAFFFYLFLSVILVAVFAIDLRNKIILDGLSFWGLLITTIFLLLFKGPDFFINLLAGFGAASFLLLLHLFTRGRGMGLGDVKFAVFAGALLGWPETATWMFLSFLTGAAVGIILIIGGKAKLKSVIAFGPFLVLAALVIFIFGHFLTGIIYK